MKKYFLSLHLILIIVVSVNGQIPKDTLYGKVKSVREQLFFLNENKQSNNNSDSWKRDYGYANFIYPDQTLRQFKDVWYKSPSSRYVNYFKKFFENGKTAEETWYNKIGKEISTFKYDYDTVLNLLREREIYDDTSVDTHEYHYSYPHQMISSIYYRTTYFGDYLFNLYDYDSIGNQIQVRSFDESGERHPLKYFYNKNRRVIKIIEHYPYSLYIDPKDKESIKNDSIPVDHLLKESDYDSNGNLTIEKNYSPDFKNIWRHNGNNKYFYDQDNNLVKVEHLRFTKDTSDFIIQFSFNANNQLIKEINESKDRIKDEPAVFKSIEYFYTNNNLTKEIYTAENKSTTIDFTYEFDEKGNWIKQTKAINGMPKYVWKRELTYY